MAHTPDTITVDILMRVHGSSESHQVATVDLPILLSHKAPGRVRQTVDPSPLADAGKALADALRQVFDDHA
ncbi:hypothetical protein ACTWPB_07550 [Nocardia sp. IBHARD005]|uniref:hypothetical protein n=1 Tax=Nocardia sp. IBHARD005 TaxID=3457765 RepID=UPI004058FE56